MKPTCVPMASAFQALRNSFCLLCFTCLLSCHSSTKKEKIVAVDSTKIILPVPGAISDSHKKMLAAFCDNWYDSVLNKNGFNGSVLVAKSGNIVYEKFRGMGHLDGSDTVDANTSFHIASVSKTLTGMAVLKLWQDGKLNIDDEFSKYFPAFDYPGVTVRTLLNHRSGLPNYEYFLEDLKWNKKEYVKNQDILDYLINRKSSLKNINTPGRHFAYCNTNFALLALLIEKVSGIPYPQFMAKEIFRPLGMDHSFVFTREDSARVVPSYDWRGQVIPMNFLDLVYGDKNIYSTPRDLLLWDRALRSGMIFKPGTLEQAYTPYSNEKPGVRNYGLGWRMNVYPNGKKMIYHNGWWHGNNAAFIRLIDEDATIIVLGNRFTRAVYKAKNLAAIFHQGYTGWDEDEESVKTSANTTNSEKKVIRKRGKRGR